MKEGMQAAMPGILVNTGWNGSRGRRNVLALFKATLGQSSHAILDGAVWMLQNQICYPFFNLSIPQPLAGMMRSIWTQRAT